MGVIDSERNEAAGKWEDNSEANQVVFVFDLRMRHDELAYMSLLVCR